MPTSILEQITANLLTTLQGITRANGFNNDLTVFRQSGVTMPSPADRQVQMFMGAAERPADPAPINHTEWMQPYYLDCYVTIPENGATATDIQINSVKADIEKAVMVDPFRGINPDTGNGLALDTFVKPETGRFVGQDGAVDGLRMRIDVHYRHLLVDPYRQ